MYCLCVNVYCHRVTTQLHLTNISYHISYHIIRTNSLYYHEQHKPFGLCNSDTVFPER